MMMKLRPIPARGNTRPATHARAFTLLEVALIVAIVGMMLLMLIGYAFAPKKPAVLPPVAKPTPIPPVSSYVPPAPRKAEATPVPAPPAAAVVTPAPASASAPAPATPAATPAPTQTIDLSPQSVPIFR